VTSGAQRLAGQLMIAGIADRGGRQALTGCRQALDIFTHLNDGIGEAEAWENLAYTYEGGGDRVKAVPPANEAFPYIANSEVHS